MKKLKLISGILVINLFMSSSCGRNPKSDSDFQGGASASTTVKNESSDFIQKIEEVKIGNQVWMASNLNVDRFKNGDIIPQVKSDAQWVIACDDKKPAWCYYENESENGPIYGKLYNLYAVHDPRGLAPEGWRIPSNIDWATLTDYLGGEQVAGAKLKSKTGWRPNCEGTNESGFSALPNGMRYTKGNFGSIGFEGKWWSLSELSSDINNIEPFVRGLSYDDRVLDVAGANKYRAGMSVRCIKE